jgi:DNA modification methylase
MTTQGIIPGDCIAGLRTLPDASVHCCVTSPPYWGLRDYGHDGQIGLESTPEAYVARMVEVFREVRRVLREDGTCWVNLGDSYNGIGGPGKQNGGPIGPTAAIAIEGTNGRRISGLKPKDLVGIPWRVAFALQADGWWLRQDIIWHKPNPIP